MTTRDAKIFVKFFTHNKNLTSAQKSRLDFLLARDCTQISAVRAGDENVVRLLEIWETEGLDAAVKAWKEGPKKTPKRKKAPKREKDNAPEEANVPFSVDIEDDEFSYLPSVSELDDLLADFDEIKNTPASEKVTVIHGFGSNLLGSKAKSTPTHDDQSSDSESGRTLIEDF